MLMRDKQVIATLLVMSTLIAPRLVHAQEGSAFTPGEQTTYRVQYLGVSAGSAQVTVGAETEQWGQNVWPIVAIAKTDTVMAVYPIKDRFVTYWDRTQQRSIGSDLMADENRKRRRLRIKMDHAGRSAAVVKQKEGEAPDESTHEIEAGSADVTAATFALRNKPLAVGESYEMPVFTGSRSIAMRATVEQKQELQTTLGAREVYKVRVQTGFSGKLQSKRDLFVYFTTDDAHLPVRFEAELVLGSVVADLTDYKPGITLAANLPRPASN